MSDGFAVILHVPHRFLHLFHHLTCWGHLWHHERASPRQRHWILNRVIDSSAGTSFALISHTWLDTGTVLLRMSKDQDADWRSHMINLSLLCCKQPLNLCVHLLLLLLMWLELISSVCILKDNLLLILQIAPFLIFTAIKINPNLKLIYALFEHRNTHLSCPFWLHR